MEMNAILTDSPSAKCRLVSGFHTLCRNDMLTIADDDTELTADEDAIELATRGKLGFTIVSPLIVAHWVVTPSDILTMAQTRLCRSSTSEHSLPPLHESARPRWRADYIHIRIHHAE